MREYCPGTSEDELNKRTQKLKEDGKSKEFDCIIGISGSVDSASLAYTDHQLSLRMLAVHVDTGWNSEITVRICAL